MNEEFPDRLSVDPNSPYYNADVLTRDVGIRFNGQEKTTVEEYCISEGWIRVTAGNARDRHGNPLNITVHGPVEPYFKDNFFFKQKTAYEISVRATRVNAIVQRLLDDGRVKLAGLGARDSLRLEAGLCLYGHDIDETTSPIEAGLAWSIPRRRREEGGFPGAARVQDELANAPARRRVGLKPDGRAPAREGA